MSVRHGGKGAGHHSRITFPVSRPTPLAVADFKNGVYSIGGVSKTLAQMFTKIPDWDNNYDPSSVVAGQGLQLVQSTNGSGFVGPGVSAEVFAAVTREFIGVAEYTMTCTGDPTLHVAGVGIDVLPLPGDFSVGWQWGTRLDLPYAWDQVLDYSGTYSANQPLPYPQGHYKSAYMFCEEGLASSINGLPAISPAGIPQLNPDANAIVIALNADSDGTVTVAVTLDLLKFYAAEQPTSILPLLSAP